jgi:hypothetical protein
MLDVTGGAASSSACHLRERALDSELMLLLEKRFRMTVDAAGRRGMTVCAAGLFTAVALALLSRRA